MKKLAMSLLEVVGQQNHLPNFKPAPVSKQLWRQLG